LIGPDKEFPGKNGITMNFKDRSRSGGYYAGNMDPGSNIAKEKMDYIRKEVQRITTNQLCNGIATDMDR
jgi:hypothetical protein